MVEAAASRGVSVAVTHCGRGKGDTGPSGGHGPAQHGCADDDGDRGADGSREGDSGTGDSRGGDGGGDDGGG